MRAAPLAMRRAPLAMRRAPLTMRAALRLTGALLSGVLLATTAHAATVELFSPEGTVKQVRQATARFSAPMVALGDPRLAAPFDPTCTGAPAAGRGRWVDGRHWVYDFVETLPAGVKCRFASKAGLESLDGSPVPSTTFEFDTGGPAIRASLPAEGASDIDQNSFFILALDAPADAGSVARFSHCEVSGIGERIPVEVIGGEVRAATLSAAREIGYPYARLLAPDQNTLDPAKDADAIQRAEAALTVLSCRRALPAETEVRLVWGRGITTVSGIATALDQTLTFRTRPAFTARFECDRVNAASDCLPGADMRLVFSAPIVKASAQGIRLVAGEITYPAVVEDGDTVQAVSFEAPFPEHTGMRVEIPSRLVDDAGRPLANEDRFPLDVATDGFPPLARFSGEFGILEAAEGGVLPVTLRALEPDVAARRLPAATAIPGAKRRIDDDGDIVRWIERVREAMAPRGEWVKEGDNARWRELTGSSPVLDGNAAAESFLVPKPEGAATFEVVGIPLGGPGFYVVELASPKLGAALLGTGQPRYVATTALVTNLAVHFAWGRERSLVWVTSLDAGAPVAGANVRVSDYCTGNVLWRGVTGENGVADIETGGVPPPHEYAGCHDWHPAPVFVSARLEGDLGFAVSSWNAGLTPGTFGLPQGQWTGPYLVHTVFDRTLLRAGETVSMKHYLRRQTATGFDVPQPPPGGKIVLAHQGSGQTYEFPLQLDAEGIAETVWEIPADAKLGSYQVRIDAPLDGREATFWPGEFRVEQYRVPTMRAVVQAPPQPLVNAQSAVLDLAVSHLSGGGASGAAVKLRTVVEPRHVSHPEYEEFVFGGDDIEEGSHAQNGEDWYFDSANAVQPAGPARVLPVTLDDAGAARATVSDLPRITAPHTLVAELEYQDSNGELSSVSSRVALWPAAVQVGIAATGWTASTDELRFRVLTLGLDGKPAAGSEVLVELFTRNVYSYRKRLIGGFYAYENQTEVKRIEPTCEGGTDTRGLLICELEPGVSGAVVLRATAIDPEGNRTIATREMWLAGEDEWWFGATEGDRMDVLPEQKRYEPGDTARLQIRTPFREATALVTMQREGVLHSFVTELNGTEPVIEVPIDTSYAPNVYVSVLAVRGRVGSLATWFADLARSWDLPWKLDGGSPTALVDLSKPAYRLGIARIDVGWAPHQLVVKVEPDKEVFKVRERIQVKVNVRRADGGAMPANAEFAFAAVDEGLLELSPNNSWQLLDAMMQRRGIEVLTSTAQMQVVGKRHYGRKAVPHGGGGGHEPARELFDTLLSWQGRVRLDADGSATLDVPLVDSLTSYRLVAVASAGDSLFGSGSTTIRTTQDLILNAGVALKVREGDRYAAIFTVRNASSHELPVRVTAAVTAGKTEQRLPGIDVALPAGAARELSWTFEAPVGVDVLSWDVSASPTGGSTGDRLRVEQQVVPVHPVRVQQATLTQLDGPWRIAVERPAGAATDRGGIELALRERLADGLGGVQEYMASYPYSCLEQRVSQAVALRDAARWDEVMRDLPTYLDRDGLVQFFPSDVLPGEDTLTSYVLTLAHEAGLTLPDPQRTRMLAALTGFVEGRIERESALPTADLVIRKIAAIAALARHNAADPRLLSSITVELNLWPTSAVIDWLDIVSRLESMPDRNTRRQEAERVLRARMNLQGTTLGFSTEKTDTLSWLMVSPDLNAVRALSLLVDAPAWRDDVPRLARGALGRRDQGHWSTTPANAWGVVAFDRFSDAFEKTPVTGRTTATLNSLPQSNDWPSQSNDHTSQPPDLVWSWPDNQAMLNVEHRGGGKPWATLTTRAALPLKEPLFTGFTVERELVPVSQALPDRWSRGDVVRVHITVDAQADATWVVVDDPVPAGATLLGSGLGRDSTILTANSAGAGADPVYIERRFDAYRAYFRYVPQGRFELEYTVRLNVPGYFDLPATRVEAMYAPETFGELPNSAIEVYASP